MLDEAAKRKPNFSERNSAPVVLADSQTWWIPKPWLEIRPVFRGGKAGSAYPVYTQGPILDALIEGVAEADTRMEQICFLASLAAELLCWQYDLVDDELDQLLCFRRSDEASEGWTRDVFAIATGQSGLKA